MTFKQLSELLKFHSIPDDVIIQSDSGWECGETDCDGIFYNAQKNIIMLTQKYMTPHASYSSSYYDSDKGKAKGWVNISTMNHNNLNINPPLKSD